MKMKWVYNLALILILISSAGILSGCGHHRSPEKRAIWITEKIASRLDLNESQRAELNSFRDELLAKKKELYKSHMTIHDTLVEQLGHERIDQEHLKEVIRQEDARVDDMISFFVERLASLHSTLSPEQREKLIEMIKEWKDHKHKYYRYRHK